MRQHRSTFTSHFLLITLFAVALISCGKISDETNSDTQETKQWAIAIHGGAGVISKDLPQDVKNEYTSALQEALDTGTAMLEEGADAMDVVESVIQILEANPRFNAGAGAVYTSNAEHELDASIMNGATLECGAVAGVKTVKSPISLARLVISETPHVLLAGSGADAFAKEQGVELVDNSFFNTERRRKQLERAQQKNSSADLTSPDYFDEEKMGTVGCVVLDSKGNLAAGTSTGGMTNKKYGRVGDSPIIGAGTYANNNSCAVSATGTGEEFIRYSVAYRISALMEMEGKTLAEAGDHVIHNVLQPGDGGVITVDKHGNIHMPYNSKGMFRAAADADGHNEVKIWE